MRMFRHLVSGVLTPLVPLRVAPSSGWPAVYSCRTTIGSLHAVKGAAARFSPPSCPVSPQSVHACRWSGTCLHIRAEQAAIANADGVAV